MGNRPTMLGRVAGKDTEHLDYIVIPQTTIGRRHALIEYKDFAYWIIDQGSINGTFVNGQPVTSEVRLKHGDKIQLHKCEFEFSMPDMDDAGMTVISKTVVANQPATEIDDETVALGSSDADLDEDDLPEPDFDLDVTGGEFDEENSETPTEIKGSAREKHDADEESDETIMLDDDGSQSEMDDDATIRPDSMDSK